MNNKDLIERGEAKVALGQLTLYCAQIDGDNVFVVKYAEMYEALDGIPPVPQEMTVGELAKVYRRMCESNPNSCEGCPVCPIGNQICELPEPWEIAKMVDILPIVEKWAQEHPEEKNEK